MVSEQILQEIADGQGEKLTRLAKLIPSHRNGRPATLACVLRWILQGSVGPDGDRVYMEAVRTPSGWVSTPAAVARFFSNLTPTKESDPSSRCVSKRKSPRRPTASEKAAELLEKLGI